jgi:Putative beta-barrel porin 2
MKHNYFFTHALCFWLLGSSLTLALDPSQTPSSALDKAMQIKGHSTSDEAVSEDGGNLSVLKKGPKALRYHFGIFNDVEYQSNANLEGNGGKGSAVWFPGLEAGVVWNFAQRWSWESAVSAEAGIYSSLENQDYWGVNLRNQLKFTLDKKLPFLYAGPDLYRYQSFDTGDEISRAVAPKVGLGYGYLFQDTQTNLFSDIRYQHHFVTSAADTSRDTIRVLAGVTQQLVQNVFLQGYYEYRFSDYEDAFGREDSRHTFGGSLIWEATRNLSLRLNTSFIDNDSTDANAAFQTINTGLGSALTWSF